MWVLGMVPDLISGKLFSMCILYPAVAALLEYLNPEISHLLGFFPYNFTHCFSNHKSFVLCQLLYVQTNFQVIPVYPVAVTNVIIVFFENHI